MPFTEEFNKIRRKFGNQYSDKAKAETFAFKTAFDEGVKTFRDRKPKPKILENQFDLELDF